MIAFSLGAESQFCPKPRSVDGLVWPELLYATEDISRTGSPVKNRSEPANTPPETSNCVCRRTCSVVPAMAASQGPIPLVAPRNAELAALYALDSIKGFGPQKVKDLYLAGISSSEVLQEPESLPIKGKR